MASRGQFLVINDLTAGTVFKQPVDIALLVDTALTIWLDAQFSDIDVNTYILEMASRKPAANGAEQLVTSLDAAHAPPLISTTDGQVGANPGFTNAGVPSNTHVPLRGTTDLVLPPAPWYVGIVSLMNTPSGVGVQWATSDPTTKGAFACTSTGVVRYYDNYSSVVHSSAAGINDGVTPALWEVSYDASNNLLVQRNRTTVISANVVLPTYVDRVLRFSSINNLGVEPTALLFGYWEYCIVANAITAELLAEVKAVTLQRHPSWIIA